MVVVSLNPCPQRSDRSSSCIKRNQCKIQKAEKWLYTVRVRTGEGAALSLPPPSPQRCLLKGWQEARKLATADQAVSPSFFRGCFVLFLQFLILREHRCPGSAQPSQQLEGYPQVFVQQAWTVCLLATSHAGPRAAQHVLLA